MLQQHIYMLNPEVRSISYLPDSSWINAQTLYFSCKYIYFYLRESFLNYFDHAGHYKILEVFLPQYSIYTQAWLAISLYSKQLTVCWLLSKACKQKGFIKAIWHFLSKNSLKSAFFYKWFSFSLINCIFNKVWYLLLLMRSSNKIKIYRFLKLK